MLIGDKRTNPAPAGSDPAVVRDAIAASLLGVSPSLLVLARGWSPGDQDKERFSLFVTDEALAGLAVWLRAQADQQGEQSVRDYLLQQADTIEGDLSARGLLRLSA
jgi:hypothetical protein